MKRFLIFAVLFPPLGLLIGILAVPEARTYIDTSFTLWMLGLAYTVGTVPALLSALADWSLTDNPIHVRVLGTAAAGTLSIMAAVVVFNFAEMLRAPVVGLIALIGAVPAVICSLLSSRESV